MKKKAQQPTFEELSLFDVSQNPKPENRCRNCFFIYQHQYSKTKYCGKQTGARTAYGHKKIKANDAACPMFEKKIKEPKL